LAGRSRTRRSKKATGGRGCRTSPLAGSWSGPCLDLSRSGKSRPLPKAIAEDHIVTCLRTVLVRGEAAPVHKACAEQPKVVRRDVGGSHLFAISAGDVHGGTSLVERRNVFEDAGLFTPVAEVGDRRPCVRPVWAGIHELDNAVGVRISQWLEQDRVDHRENGGVGTDPNRQCGN
jgi:hypothetical protein